MNRAVGLSLAMVGVILLAVPYVVGASPLPPSPPAPVTCGSVSNPCPPPTTTTTAAGTTTTTSTFTLITTQTVGNTTTVQSSATMMTGTAITAFNPSGGASVPITPSYPTSSVLVTLRFTNCATIDAAAQGNCPAAPSVPFTLYANPGFSGPATVISPSVLTPGSVSAVSGADGSYSFTAQFAIGTISTCVYTSSTSEICGVPTPTPPFYQGTANFAAGSYAFYIQGFQTFPDGSVRVSPVTVNVGQQCNAACQRTLAQSVVRVGSTSIDSTYFTYAGVGSLTLGGILLVLGRKNPTGLGVGQ